MIFLKKMSGEWKILLYGSMISDSSKNYCCDDLSLVENYNEAVKDTNNMWECHHRKETDCGLRQMDLVESGLYYDRPASELIFLTKSDHKKIHFLNDKKWISGLSDAKKKPIAQFNKKTGALLKVWKCGLDINKELGYGLSAIYTCCAKKIPTAYDYIWRYADPEKNYKPHHVENKPLF